MTRRLRRKSCHMANKTRFLESSDVLTLQPNSAPKKEATPRCPATAFLTSLAIPSYETAMRFTVARPIALLNLLVFRIATHHCSPNVDDLGDAVVVQQRLGSSLPFAAIQFFPERFYTRLSLKYGGPAYDWPD